MNEDTIHILRSIFQHKINLHPIWNKEEREILATFFKLDEEELDSLDILSNWISNHGLEKLFRGSK